MINEKSNLEIVSFFDSETHTISYLVIDLESTHCAVIDPVLDYDLSSGTTSVAGVNKIIAAIEQRSLNLQWILETHVHADHLSSAHYLKSAVGGKVCICSKVECVCNTVSQAFNFKRDVGSEKNCFDVLLKDNDILPLGRLEIRALHTPGHTPACMTYQIGDALFVGDTLLMPDYGTARCDFPGGDPKQLYKSIQRIFSFDNDTRLFLCHDYLPEGRSEFQWQTTVGEQKKSNVHVRDGVSLEDFVASRTKRDESLDMPKLMLPAIRFNISAPKGKCGDTSHLKA